MAEINTVRIGTNIYGKAAMACTHMEVWWDLFKALVKQEVGVNLEIVQALGSALASAGTHGAPGTALDLRTKYFTYAKIIQVVRLAREAGAPATWYRSGGSWAGNEHIHLVLDCPHWSPADYQVSAVKAGYNGLGSGGRGGPDPHAQPSVWRSYSTGVTWMRSQLNSLPLAPTTPSPGLPSTGVSNPEPNQEDVMTPEQEARVIAAVNKAATEVATAAQAAAAAGPARDSIEKMGEASARHTWRATKVVRHDENGNPYYTEAIQELADAKGAALRAAASGGLIAGLSKAIEALSTGTTYSLQEIVDAAKQGTAEALDAKLNSATIEITYE